MNGCAGERGIGVGVVLGKQYRGSSRGVREGKWETWVWFSTFLSALRRRCGNVENSRWWRVFQGAVGRVENLQLVFQAFHGPGISTALCLMGPSELRVAAVGWRPPPPLTATDVTR